MNPDNLTPQNCRAQNLVNGTWVGSEQYDELIDPMTGEVMGALPSVQRGDESKPFIDSLKAVPKSGLHNPLKRPDRYLLYGDVSRKAAEVMHDKSVEDFFTKMIQRVVPKSDAQARGEVIVTRNFLENFAGDNVRFLARSFANPGDHTGQ